MTSVEPDFFNISAISPAYFLKREKRCPQCLLVPPTAYLPGAVEQHSLTSLGTSDSVVLVASKANKRKSSSPDFGPLHFHVSNMYLSQLFATLTAKPLCRN
jgi:hypothetical protein